MGLDAISGNTAITVSHGQSCQNSASRTIRPKKGAVYAGILLFQWAESHRGAIPENRGVTDEFVDLFAP